MAAVKLILLFIFQLSAEPNFNQSFYWQKPDQRQRMLGAERYIPILVSSSEKQQAKIWLIKGAGILKAPAKFTFDRALDFKQLEQTGSFEKVEWDSEKSQLLLEYSLLGQKRESLIKISTRRSADLYTLDWRVIEGSFLASSGALQISQKEFTEVSLLGEYQGKIPWPFGSVFAISLEAFTQVLARKLRSQVEEEWKKHESANGA